MSKKSRKEGELFNLSKNKILEITDNSKKSLYNDFGSTLELFPVDDNPCGGMRTSFPASHFGYIEQNNGKILSVKDINTQKSEILRTTGSEVNIYLSNGRGWVALPLENMVPGGMDSTGYVRYLAKRLYVMRQAVWNFEVPHVKG